MTPEERAVAIAARIADGSAIDWTVGDTPADQVDPRILHELKAIAGLASLHRAPSNRPGASPAALSQWGPLTIVDVIGEGRFGRVYRAWDARLQRQVALKILHTPLSSAPKSSTQVIEEARLLARVRHPNVLTVHGAEVIGGDVGIWTEFIEGKTLEAVVHESGPLPADQVHAIGIDLCRALGAVHAADLLHRDIKAQNVMRETGGRIVLMDFGTGHDLDVLPPKPGDLSGTPLYLAPEIFAGSRPSVSSDLYALAVLLFYLLTGQHPVSGQTLDDVRAGHRELRLRRLAAERADAPPNLVRAIERGLLVDPARRYHSASEFESELALLQDRVPFSRHRRARLLATGVARLLRGVGVVAAAASVVLLASDAVPSFWPQLSAAGWSPGFRIPYGDMGHASRDGRFLPYVDEQGDVKVFELATGWSRTIAERSNDSDGTGVTWTFGPTGQRVYPPRALAVMSPKGDQIAYTWAVGPAESNQYELRLANADGTRGRTLLERRSAYQPVPVDWSADGRQILCWLNHQNGVQDLVLVPIVDNSIRVLYNQAGGVPETSLSPDARFVAFQRLLRSGASGVALMATTGPAPQAEPRDLFPSAATSSPIWIDDRHLFFLRQSQQGGDWGDGWIAQVIDGKVAGDPVMVIKGQTDFDPVFDVTGHMAIQKVDGKIWNEVYTRTIDLSGRNDPLGASRPGEPVRISPTEIDHHLSPSWSPNGRQIAYYTGHPSAVPWLKDDPVLTVQDVGSSVARELPTGLELARYPPQWLADSRSVLVYGSDVPTSKTETRVGWYGVDVWTGKAHPVLVGLSPLAQFLSGQRVLYRALRPDTGEPTGTLMLRAFGTEGETLSERLFDDKGAGLGRRFRVSPDEHWVAFETQVREATGLRQMIEVQAMAGGNAHEVVHTTGSDLIELHAWTPDSRSLLYTQGSGTAPRPLFIASIDGGEHRDLHVKIPIASNPLSINPAGDQIVYPENIRQRTLWIRPVNTPVLTERWR